MQEWLNGIFQSPQWGFTLLFGALLLGVFSAIVSCFNIAALGAVAGYAGTKENKNKAELFLTALSFVAGILIALAVIGLIIGLVGQVASAYLQRFGRLLAGVVAISFGLIVLDLFPIRLPSLKIPVPTKRKGIIGDILFGFALGGSALACTVTCCSPILPVVMGMAAIEGQMVKSVLVMGLFGIGFALPMAAILMGFSFGKISIGTSRFMPVIKKIGGTLLIGAGFYFLVSAGI